MGIPEAIAPVARAYISTALLRSHHALAADLLYAHVKRCVVTVSVGGRVGDSVEFKSRVGCSVMAWFRIVLAGAVLSLIALASTMPAAANPQDTNARTRYMRVFGAAAPPYGFVQFCRSFHGECKTKDRQLERLQATPERLVELDRINRAVNAMITPATDREIFGIMPEVHTIQVGRKRNGKYYVRELFDEEQAHS